MNFYNITITPEDLEEGEPITIEAAAEDLETMEEIIQSELKVMTDEVAFDYGGHYIVISDHSEGGYYYSRYESKEAYDAGDEDIDGGLCTTTLSNAIGMALN